MKHHFSTLLLAVLLNMTAGIATAHAFEVDGIYYSITSSEYPRTVAVTSSSYNYSGSVTIPQTVTYGVKTYSVTSIGNRAFKDCKSLTSVTIPNSVTSIGNSAFSGCSALTSVYIPNGVTSIESSAFSDCSALTSVYIPNGVTLIGNNIFENCNALTKAEFASVESLCSMEFPGYASNPLSYAHHLYVDGKEITDLVISNSATKIGGYALYGCSRLTSITIPNSVISIGNSAFSGCSGLNSITIPNSVTDIGRSAFSDCSGLTSISIPNSVTSIGSSAFFGCSGLTSIAIPNGVRYINSSAFYQCSSLTSITIPNSVISIGSSAFSGCSGLTSITIPNSVTSIGDDTFSGCNGLTSITIPNSVTKIGGYAFAACSSLTSVTIPKSVTEIGGYAFFDCSRLTSVTINSNAIASQTYRSSYSLSKLFGTQVKNYVFSDNVQNIGAYACYGCSNLTSVTISKSVTSIADDVFEGCNGLTKAEFASVKSLCSIKFSGYDSNPLHYAHHLYVSGKEITDLVIPNSVTKIGMMTFSGCSGLTSVTIPNSVTEIGAEAFSGCSNLTSVTISNSVTSIANDVFEGCNGLTKAEFASVDCLCNMKFASWTSNPLYYAHHLYVSGKEITDLVIPSSVTTIGNYAFSGCSGLNSVTIPNSVTTIGAAAFSSCSGLNSITIPNSVTSIGNSAFYGCSDLTSVNIPNSVTSIGGYAFYHCYGLTSITIPSSVTEIGAGAFMGCRGLTSVTIPSSVTLIGDGAFSGCSGLTSVTIPNRLTTIGERVFSGCSSLTSITIPKSVTNIGSNAFQDCPNITQLTLSCQKVGNWFSDICSQIENVTLQDGVTEIGQNAFKGFSKLTTLKLPATITIIGNSAFSGCTGLQKVIIPNLAAWCEVSLPNSYANPLMYAHHLYSDDKTEIKDLVIPEGVVSIGVYQFYGCSELKSVKLPKSVTTIGNYAFKDCSNITQLTLSCQKVGNWFSDICSQIEYVTLQDGVNEIGQSAIKGFSKVSNINLPNSLTTIGNEAFKNCSGLTSMNIPKNVTSIGSSSFDGCNELNSFSLNCQNIGNWFSSCKGVLETLTLGSEVKTVDVYAFYNCTKLANVSVLGTNTQISDQTFKGCTGITSLTLNCEEIGSWFNDSKKLVKQLTLLGGVKEIGTSAFQGFSALSEVSIPNSVTTIDDNAFEGCTSAKRLNIGNSVYEIGSKAFANWKKLEDVYCYAVRYPTAGSDVFENSYIDYAVLHVPAQSLDNYKSRLPWSGFKDIVPIDEVISQDVTLSSAGYATFYDSQAAYSLPSGVKACVVTTASDDKLTYEELTEGFVPKGVAVMLKNEQLKGGTFTLTRVEDDMRYTGENLLCGSDEATMTSADGDCYFYKLAYGTKGSDLASVFGWYWGAAGGAAFMIEGHKAWLAIPKAQVKKIRSFSIEGEATAIASLEENETATEDNVVYYDLQGRRISQPSRNGIYIRNGKKVAFAK